MSMRMRIPIIVIGIAYISAGQMNSPRIRRDIPLIRRIIPVIFCDISILLFVFVVNKFDYSLASSAFLSSMRMSAIFWSRFAISPFLKGPNWFP